MKIALVSKLKNCLSSNHLEEKDVVYILVEIGKLIELGNLQDEYPTLWFYRNWVVHSKIDRQSPFVQGLHQKFQYLHADPDTFGLVFSFVHFIELKNNLITFAHRQLEYHPLDKTCINSFEKALIQVIADVPVILGKDNNIVISYNQNAELKIMGPGKTEGSIIPIK